jgi:hypothetical protein
MQIGVPAETTHVAAVDVPVGGVRSTKTRHPERGGRRLDLDEQRRTPPRHSLFSRCKRTGHPEDARRAEPHQNALKVAPQRRRARTGTVASAAVAATEKSSVSPRGGPGPNSVGQRNSTAVPQTPDRDVFRALTAWSEKGVEPQSITATHFTNNGTTLPVDRTCPLCPYPQVAKYKGSRSTRVPSNNAELRSGLETAPLLHQAPECDSRHYCLSLLSSSRLAQALCPHRKHLEHPLRQRARQASRFRLSRRDRWMRLPLSPRKAIELVWSAG